MQRNYNRKVVSNGDDITEVHQSLKDIQDIWTSCNTPKPESETTKHAMAILTVIHDRVQLVSTAEWQNPIIEFSETHRNLVLKWELETKDALTIEITRDRFYSMEYISSTDKTLCGSLNRDSAANQAYKLYLKLYHRLYTKTQSEQANDNNSPSDDTISPS